MENTTSEEDRKSLLFPLSETHNRVTNIQQMDDSISNKPSEEVNQSTSKIK